MNQTASAKRVCFVTLGCAKNEVDTDRMRSLVDASRSFECVESPEDADVVVVNTCAFLTSAVAEGVETTLDLVNERVEGGVACLVVMCGCIPSRYGSEVVEEMPEVAAFVPVDEEDGIVGVLGRVLGLGACDTGTRPPVGRTVESACAYIKYSLTAATATALSAPSPTSAAGTTLVPSPRILDEARFLVEGGVRELVLIGQDTGVWGSDLPGRPTLARLLRAVADVVPSVDGWVRVLYLQPEGLTQELVDTIREVPQIVPYIDIPLQHASASVLKRMNRTGSRTEFMAMVRRLRDEVPGITLRTTAMVGFPGESEEEFAELTEFLKEAEFDYCAVFSYSQEEGTAAAELPDQVSSEVKLAREQQVIDLCEANGFASASRRIGNLVCRVLVERRRGRRRGGLRGRRTDCVPGPGLRRGGSLGRHRCRHGRFYRRPH